MQNMNLIIFYGKTLNNFKNMKPNQKASIISLSIQYIFLMSYEVSRYINTIKATIYRI